MYVEVTKGEGRKGAGGENDVRWDRARVVRATFGAVGIDDREASGGGVEKTVGGEMVKCHYIAPPKEPREKGNSRQKGTFNVKGDPGLAGPGRGRGKNGKQIKRG